MQSIVVWHKNKNKFVVIICGNHVNCIWKGYFTHPADSSNIPMQKQFTWSPQSDHSLTCSCYIMPYYNLFSCEFHILDLWWRSYCGHYIYGPWLIMTSQWVMKLIRMPHCCITEGNDIAKDIVCDVIMGNAIAIYTYYDITMHNDIVMNLFSYVLLHQIMILLFYQ